jgi:transcriptional regulator with XRE-family HTH domain
MAPTTRHFSGARLRQARLAANMSQADLSRAIGKAEINVGRWERGEHEPRGESVALIATATGKDIEFFYVESEEDDDEEEAAMRRAARDLLAPLNDAMVEALLAECRARIDESAQA